MLIHERADEEDDEREVLMQQARLLEPVPNGDESPLARARVHRKLTVEEAARRADLPEEQVQWLEDGRLYRFPTSDHALLAMLLYATALGIDHREAQELAGLPVPPAPLKMNPLRRFGAMTAFAALILAAVLAIAFARSESSKPKSAGAASPTSAAALPAPWAIKVVVLNGSGDIVYTRSVASRVQALSYRVVHVGRASTFNYPQTQVYYPPGGEAIAVRLAKQLDVPVQPLPGGSDSRRLVVIVGPERGPGP
jgi:LytR cell envelope-related transcriptional attenuator/Helix-turn-helix domain